MKNSKKSELSMPASWRNLKKSPRRKGSSGISIRRRWVAMLRVSLGLVAISLAGILVFQTLKSDPNPSIRQRDFTGPFPPVKNLIFSSETLAIWRANHLRS